MKVLWPILLAVFRSLYFGYALWCLAFPLAFLYWCFAYSDAVFWSGLVMAAVLIIGVYLQRTQADPNPWQSGFLAWFGTLKVFSTSKPGAMVGMGLPSAYLVENPRSYRIDGRNLRKVLSLLEPGDILLRGYDGYIDGTFIRRAARCSEKGYQPGWYTHAAVYVGALGEDDRALVPKDFAHNPEFFDTGAQMVIHSMSKGVHSQDILTFTRCDYLAVLRLPQGSGLDKAQAIASARRAALSKIGEKYDFDSSDTTRFHRFSCSELVYYCLQSVRQQLNLAPRLHALYPLGTWNPRLAVFKRKTIIPDDFYDLCGTHKLLRVWEDDHSAALPGHHEKMTS
jgi:hypothetical protein